MTIEGSIEGSIYWRLAGYAYGVALALSALVAVEIFMTMTPPSQETAPPLIEVEPTHPLNRVRMLGPWRDAYERALTDAVRFDHPNLGADDPELEELLERAHIEVLYSDDRVLHRCRTILFVIDQIEQIELVRQTKGELHSVLHAVRNALREVGP